MGKRPRRERVVWVTRVTHVVRARVERVVGTAQPHAREGWAESMKALAASEAQGVWPEEMGDEVEVPAW